MLTESLAVKHRPRVLADLVGQDHIATQLKGMFLKKKMPAAILLHGSTGLGKTTVARMIARYVNCSSPDKETYAPCNECGSCRMEEHPDVIELNAGDARGIDDVRSLIAQSKNMPTIGRKKIFILDEAHQFTSQSQQCLLKPVEEPPANTIWIICTMSPDKLLPAIAKRCMQLQVKPVEPEVLVKRLYRIARREGVDFKTIQDGTKVLKTIADFANGGVRESIALLESVLYAYSGNPDIDANTVLTQFLSGNGADLDQAAVKLLVSFFSKDLIGIVEATSTDNPRGVLSKLRWLLDYLISNSIGKAKFVPYSGRLFAKEAKAAGIKVALGPLLQLQNLLVEIECRLNSQSIDERVVFQSTIGNFTFERIKNV